MTEHVPSTAYNLLEEAERKAVDDYVKYAIDLQHRKRERIIHALYLPIPYEYIKRSRDALYKPLVRAAVAEKLKEAAADQDISPSRVIQEHAAIAFSNIGDYVESVGFGDFKVKDITTISPDKMAAVKSIETKPTLYGLQTKVTLHDKHPSLKAMGEMMGLVSPDRPPPLQEYVRPPAVEAKDSGAAPETQYSQLLETIGG